MSGLGVRRKLLIVFALQACAISLAVVLGVYASSKVLKGVLIHAALSDEAALFAERLDRDPNAPPPDTYNLKGYLVTDDNPASTPDFAQDLPPGFHEMEVNGQLSMVYVESVPQGTLILLFRQEQVWSLSFYFGLIPLTLILMVIYISLWLTYKLSKRAVSPLVKLAKKVESLDLNHLDPQVFAADTIPLNTDQEVYILNQALAHLSERVQRMMDRERNFTRDASHELRTPVTVIQMAADMLLDDASLDAYQRKTVRRMKNVAKDMQALIEALMVLARDSAEGLPKRQFYVNELVTAEVARNEFLTRNKPVRLIVDQAAHISTFGSASVFSIMLGNLIRNACHYTTEGKVKVTVGDGYVAVDDTGTGMSSKELDQVFQPFFRGDKQHRGGHGVGLTIVKRLSDRFNWPVEMRSQLGTGTHATIYFPEHERVKTPVTETADQLKTG